MLFGSSQFTRVALALGYALLAAGCAAEQLPSGSGYATVPIQTLVAGASYEILDRPDVGRLTITPMSEPTDKFRTLTAQLSQYISLEPDGPNRANGSAFYEPLMQYFAQSNRTCRLIRGNPLVHLQWEFVYSCRPGYDAGAITWHASGFSNAPQYPNR